MRDTSKELTVAESKILMIYILDKAKKSISEKVYLELVTSLSDINYFDYSQLIQSLITEGYIEKNKKDEHVFLKLSEQGKEALKLTIGLLPGIIKLRVDVNFSKYYKSIREEFSVSAEYNPTKDLVICKATEENTELFKMELLVRDETEAKSIVRKWNDNAGKMYLEILNVINREW